MEDDPANKLMDLIQNRHEDIENKYGDEMIRYRQANRLSRWLIARRHPMVKDYCDYLDAQQSVSDAIRSAQQNEAYLVIH
jgi:hypothetical protein